MATGTTLKVRPIRTILICVLLLFTLFAPYGQTSQTQAFAKPAPKEQIRESAIAGTWYPASAPELRQEIEGFLSHVPSRDIPGRLTTLIAPHAGYIYSGQVAAYAYKALEKQSFQTVVVIAPSHFARFSGVSVYDRGGFKTPLGVVALDTKFISALEKRESRIRFIPEAHEKEHALEIQLPFLQVVMPNFKLVPLVMGEQDLSTCQWLAAALADTIGSNKSVLVVASSDLSHYYPYEQAKKLDEIVINRVNGFDALGLSTNLAQGQCEACGGGPIVTAMLVASRQGATSSKVLYAANSGDVTGDRAKVVGYMAAALWAGPAQKADTQPPAKEKAGIDSGLTAEEKAFLHKIVKETIEARSKNLKPPLLDTDSAALKEARGAFVTLHKHGELRGCIGQIVSERPLVETIAEMAVAAAFQDPRFPTVSSDELKDLDYEISVLTPLHRIKDVSEIRVGVHGIFIKKNGRAGLLLPQVATEYGWDRTTFLEQTCRKASLPKDAWKDKETEIQIFSADVF